MELFLHDPKLFPDPVDANIRLGLWGLMGASHSLTTFAPLGPPMVLQADLHPSQAEQLSCQFVGPGNHPPSRLPFRKEQGLPSPRLFQIADVTCARPLRLVVCAHTWPVKQDLSVALTW